MSQICFVNLEEEETICAESWSSQLIGLGEIPLYSSVADGTGLNIFL